MFPVCCWSVTSIITSRYLHVCLTYMHGHSCREPFFKTVIPKPFICHDGDRKHSSSLPHNPRRPHNPDHRHDPPPLILSPPPPRERRGTCSLHHPASRYHSPFCCRSKVPRVLESTPQTALNASTPTRGARPSEFHVQRANSTEQTKR
jgi:hypothetical protein